MDQDSTHMVAASKVFMLKPSEFDIWRMMIEQYIKMIDYALWEVIENGATLPKTQVVEGVTKEVPITTAEEKAQRRLEGVQSSKKSRQQKQGKLLKEYTCGNIYNLVPCDGLGEYDWSDQSEEGPNYALMAFLSSSSHSKIVDNYKKGLGHENYNAVLPLYTENFMPPTPDLSFTGLNEFVNKPVVENCKAKSSEEENKVVRKNDDSPIIEEWVSNNEEEDVSQPKVVKKIVRPSIAKIEFVKPTQQ
uniref:Uncharacterized protein n=1 Tax=Tanacetum cinerariifolium TaxID=118510 RepID=A0A699HJ33_TANCI|nr:hypothetical protein [Tanacetum cinerariifolium]